MNIPVEDWKWFGTAGHFICGHHCQFHLCTQVGGWLVSTVGEYMPDEGTREILAQSRNIKLEGRGDYRYADFMKKVGFVEIGCDRTYETMVFRAGNICERPDCDCGMPEISGNEVDMRGYSLRGDAAVGHLELCRMYAGVDPIEMN